MPDLSQEARFALLAATRQSAGFVVACSERVASELSGWFGRLAAPLLSSPDEDQRFPEFGIKFCAGKNHVAHCQPSEILEALAS